LSQRICTVSNENITCGDPTKISDVEQNDIQYFYPTTKSDFTFVTNHSLIHLNTESNTSVIDSKEPLQPVYYASVNKPKKGQVASLVRNFLTKGLKLVDSTRNVIHDINPNLFQCTLCTNAVDCDINGKKGFIYGMQMVEEGKNHKYLRLVWTSNDGIQKKYTIPFYYTNKGGEEVMQIARVKETLLILFKIPSEKKMMIALMKIEDIQNHLFNN
jgi:hypothetical protein